MLGTDFFSVEEIKRRLQLIQNIIPSFLLICFLFLLFFIFIFLGNQAEYNVFLLTVPMLNLPSGFRWQDLIDCIIFPQGPCYPVLIYTLYLYFCFVYSFQVLEFVFFFWYMCTNCEYLVLPNSGGTGGVIRYGTNMQGPDVSLVREAHDRIGILNLIISGYVLSFWFFLHHSLAM